MMKFKNFESLKFSKIPPQARYVRSIILVLFVALPLWVNSQCTTPTALTTGANIGVAKGSSVTSTATGGAGGTVTWAIAPTTGVSTSSGTGSSTGNITFSTAGTYTVTFTSDNGCGTASSTKTVTRTIKVFDSCSGTGVSASSPTTINGVTVTTSLTGAADILNINTYFVLLY